MSYFIRTFARLVWNDDRVHNSLNLVQYIAFFQFVVILEESLLLLFFSSDVKLEGW